MGLTIYRGPTVGAKCCGEKNDKIRFVPEVVRRRIMTVLHAPCTGGVPAETPTIKSACDREERIVWNESYLKEE